MKRRDFLTTPALGALLPSAMLRLRAADAPALPGSDAVALPPASRTAEQRLHQDFITWFTGIEYFILGNGDIQAVLQYAPDRAGEHPATFLGLTLMSPEHLSRKWSTFLFHPERGFERTMLMVTVDGSPRTARPETLTGVRWTFPDAVPTVRLSWTAGPCSVEEEFFVPAEGGLLYRRVTLKNGGPVPVRASASIQLLPNFALFDEIGTDARAVHAEGFFRMRLLCPGEQVTTAGRYGMDLDAGVLAPGTPRTITYVYAIDAAGEERRLPPAAAGLAGAKRWWQARNSLTTGNELLDRFYRVSCSGIRAMVSRRGKRDGGFWEYQMEWAGDDALGVVGMLQAGMTEEPRTVLAKVLTRSIGPDGRTLEAGRMAPLESTEFVQGGIILFALWVYASWTGDLALLRRFWSTITRIAEFPLIPYFRDEASGLLHNKREWWERGAEFGVEDGFELAYQFWVAFGLRKAAALAHALGDEAAGRRWHTAAMELEEHYLRSGRFRLVEDDHLIKRRTRDGRWQRAMVPKDRGAMPPGSPLATEEHPECEPDTSTLWPIIYGAVDPADPVARGTLRWMEQIWNQRWNTGGYPRYNVTSEPDPPAPWPLASMLVARAYAEVGDAEHVWRVLRWLNSIHGGLSGGWFERDGQSITPPAPPVGVLGWIWEEIVSLLVHGIAGFRPELESIIVRPRLLDGIDGITAPMHVRGLRIDLAIRRDAEHRGAELNGRPVDGSEGRYVIPYALLGRRNRLTVLV